jgi:hypothetical protein
MTERDESPEDSRIGALYRRSPGEEPPAELDRAILAAARSSASRRRYRAPIPWAVAATLVLTVGIGWQVLQVGVEPVVPASAPPETESLEARSQAAFPARVPTPAEDAAPAGAASEVVPRMMMREATPAKKAPPEIDGPARYSTMPPQASAPYGPVDCEPYALAEDAPLSDWHQAIAAARQAGDTKRVLCLEQQLRQRKAGTAEPPGIPQSASDR